MQITLDVDAFDDPTHGKQQLTFFYGYYDQHQYLPIDFTRAETDHMAPVGLRPDPRTRHWEPMTICDSS